MPAENVALTVTQSFTPAGGGALSCRVQASVAPPSGEPYQDPAVYIYISGPNNYIYESNYEGFTRTFEVAGLYDGEYTIDVSDQYSTTATRTVTLANGYSAGGGGVSSNEFEVESLTTTQANPSGSFTGSVTITVRPTGGRTFTAARVEVHIGDFIWAEMTPPDPGSRSRRKLFATMRAGRYVASIKAIDAGGNTLHSLDRVFFVDNAPVYGCTDPAASNYNPNATAEDPAGSTCVYTPAVVPNFVEVSLMNSLRLVKENLDDNEPATLDNTLYCAEPWLYVTKPPYYQKVQRNDNVVLQFRSNHAGHEVGVWRYEANQFIAGAAVVNKITNIGVTKQYVGWLTPGSGSEANKFRLYFNNGLLPVAFVTGDFVTVQNATPSSLNQRYAIAGVLFDDTDSIPYVLLPGAYPAGQPNRINCNVTVALDVLPYNVYQAQLPLSGLAEGAYFVKLKAIQGNDYTQFISEPFYLAAEHKNTHLVTYRNYDDALGLHFSTGLLCGVRVESDFYRRRPSVSSKTSRDPSGKLIRLSSTVQRKTEFNTHQLPPWLHEKLAFAFALDYVAINGVEHIAEDGYENPSYPSMYALSNSSVLLEQVSAFTDQNEADLNDINEAPDGWLVVNGKHLKVE